MANLLSGLTDNFAKGLHKGRSKDCKSGFDYRTAKDKTLTFKYADCKKKYEKKFDEDLAKTFKNTFKFWDEDINKLCLMLGKGFYPYKYMDSWQRFN